jgi:hypothetical protein
MHRLKWVRAVVFVAIVFGAGIVVAEDYPPAFPRTGVTQVLENHRVFVWEVHWLKGVKQPIHRHRYDMAGVYLRYGAITVTTADGVARPSEPFDVPRPYYQPRDITHKEEGTGGPNDPERLAIMVDLREPNPTGAATSSKMDPAFPREGAKDVIDNERVREWDYTWLSSKNPSKPAPLRVYTRDSVQVFFAGGTIRYRTADGKETTKTVAMKDAFFIPQDTVRSEEAISGEPRAITIELK